MRGGGRVVRLLQGNPCSILPPNNFLKHCSLDDLMTSVLRGQNKQDRGKGTESSKLPTLHTIWLEVTSIGNENTIRLLVSFGRLKQLKLRHCVFESSETILEAKELCEYLMSAVSDLSIVNHD